MKNFLIAAFLVLTCPAFAQRECASKGLTTLTPLSAADSAGVVHENACILPDGSIIIPARQAANAFKIQLFGLTTATAAAAGATSNGSFAWTTSTADANYNVWCQPTGVNAGTPVLVGISINGVSGVNYSVQTSTAAASNFSGLLCLAIHTVP